MLAVHRRQPVGLVRLAVVLRPDPEEAPVEQAHGAGKHALAHEAAAAEMSFRRSPELREGAREPDHLVELLLVPSLAPGAVVDVLAPPRGVRADCLNVAERVRADPDIPPGRRYDQLADPLQHFVLVDPVSLVVEVLEAATPAAPGDPGPGAVGSA